MAVQHCQIACDCHRGRAAHRHHFSLRRPENGVFALMYACLLALIFGICGMALSLGQMYNHQGELQSMANAVAVAAARELDGTHEGVQAALTKAADTAARYKFNYTESFAWNDDAISFGSSPKSDDVWLSASSVDRPEKLSYVKMETNKLAGSPGAAQPVFLQLVSTLVPAQLSAQAIAGRAGVRALPLAICALDNAPSGSRGLELIEYGFRRGVGYDLMNLNPNADSPLHFVVDPTVGPGQTSTTHSTSAVFVGPFVCSGTMWMPRVTGGPIQVSRKFPLDPLYKQLNSRFDEYPDNLCKPNGAPPDFNIRPFTGTWMNPSQSTANAKEYKVVNTKLVTLAEAPSSALAGNEKNWGPLWSYAKAVKYASYKPGKAEPQAPLAGYSTFATSDFPTLYQAGVGVFSGGTTGYPGALAGGTPYKTHITSPTTNLKLSEEHRRVLHIPLLSCPVPEGEHVSATVLAVGKFFMTKQASATVLSAEFAGIAPDSAVAGRVELFQ